MSKNIYLTPVAEILAVDGDILIPGSNEQGNEGGEEEL